MCYKGQCAHHSLFPGACPLVVTESDCPGCEEVQQQCTRYSELRTSENLTPEFSARISVSAPVTAASVYTEQ